MAPDWPRESHEVILINIEQDWNHPVFVHVLQPSSK